MIMAENPTISARIEERANGGIEAPRVDNNSTYADVNPPHLDPAIAAGE